jgi:Ser/Thr protein kinase RdoA (MazF antagonist)
MDRETLAAEEVKFVAKEYALRRPIYLEEIRRGSRSVAKGRLRGVDGDWMLKRRPAARAGRLDLVHAFQNHLQHAGVPVASLRRNLEGATRTDGERGVYELFNWVFGSRWSLRTEEAAEVGAAIGSMLRAGAGFRAPGDAMDASAHRSQALDVDPAELVAFLGSVEPEGDHALIRDACHSLLARVARATAASGGTAVSSLPRCFMHGDLHPGNVLFAEGRLRAILDFDTTRIDLRLREVASALNAFGSEARSTDAPDRWAPGQHMDRMVAIIAGVRHGIGEPLTTAERRALPWLMIEGCARESLERIIRTGRFDQHPASLFLVYVDRKTSWIEQHADDISYL